MTRRLAVFVAAGLVWGSWGCSNSAGSGNSDRGAGAGNSGIGGSSSGAGGTVAGTASGYLECFTTVVATQPYPYTQRRCMEQAYPSYGEAAAESNCVVNQGPGETVTTSTSTTEHCPDPTTPSYGCVHEFASADGAYYTTFWRYDADAQIAAEPSCQSYGCSFPDLTGVSKACTNNGGTWMTYHLDPGTVIGGPNAGDSAGAAGAHN
jgi:hypothetical protein